MKPTINPAFWLRDDVQKLTTRIDSGHYPLDTNGKPALKGETINKILREIADDYVALYQGTFSLILDFQKQIASGRTLTANQHAAALNSLYRDYVRLRDYVDPHALVTIGSISHTPVKQLEPIIPVIVNGTFTIVLNESGDYRTLRITDADGKLNQVEGTQIVSYLSGSDNESNYTGCAFLQGTTVKVWSKFKADTALTKAIDVLVTADKETRIDLGSAYAMEAGRCWRCNRKLTVPASLHRGVGPDCAEKLGISVAPVKKYSPSEVATIKAEISELFEG